MTCSQPASEAEARAYLSSGLEGHIVRLQQQNDRLRWREILTFAALWLLGAVLTRVPEGQSLGILLLACSYNAGVLFVHEGMHGILFRGRWLNRWVGAALACSFFCSFTAYRILHRSHHVHLGGPGDPDEYYNYTNSRLGVWLMQYGRLLGATFLYLPLMPFVAWKRANHHERRDILQDYVLMAVLYLMVFGLVPSSHLVPLWLAPIFLVGLFTNLRGFVQHGITDRHDSFLASRSIHPHPLVAFLLLNENLHLEHHLFPEIPSYHLPELSRLISPRLPRAVLASSYMEVLWNFFRATPRLDETPIGIRQNL